MPADHTPARPAALLWDFDGTIVDSLPSWERAERRLLTELGVAEQEELLRYVAGYTIARVAELLVERLGLAAAQTDEIANRINSYWLEDMLRPGLEPLPGVRELLDQARAAGVRCVVASQTRVYLMRAVLDDLGLSVDALVGGDTVTRAKPDPEPYLVAASRAGAKPGDCVALDDSLTGLTSAIAAGCVAVGVAVHDRVPDGALSLPSLRGVTLDDLGDLWRQARSDASGGPTPEAPRG